MFFLGFFFADEGLISRGVCNVVWAAERYYSQAINISLKSPKHRNCSQNADATFSLSGLRERRRLVVMGFL